MCRVSVHSACKLQVDLVGYAQQLSFTQWEIVCRHAVEVVDPDTADVTLERQLADEEQQASPTPDDAEYGVLPLDPS